MNERIKKLKQQATTIHYSGLGEIDELDAEKFAELIVRECAQFCEDKNSKLLGNMMKEHFGVEE